MDWGDTTEVRYPQRVASYYNPHAVNHRMVVRVGLLNETELNEIKLNEVEVRVLGSLIEKDITTPDYYPLSLNALVNACNQKNNREPVMALDEDAVRSALESLQVKRLAGPASGADSRVTKYEHRLQEVFNFDRRETAILCVLLLRGAQTPGELRGRAERMYRFEALEDVLAALERLGQRQPPLVAVLPRQPGTKESRYIHLLSGADVARKSSLIESSLMQGATNSADDSGRLGNLENEVAELKREIAEIRGQLAEFRKQFE
ncbi:MAG: YceH family protein [Candidatus Sulfotelmatobacter sp.]